MKTLLILALVAITSLAQANTKNLEQLKNIVDEMNYALSVEWDQEDQAFKSMAMDKFFMQAKDLQEQGLTKQEMIDFLKAEYPAFDVDKTLEKLSNQININDLSDTQLADLITEDLTKSYDAGANWLWIDGRGGIYIVLPIGAFLSIVIQL